MSLPYFFSYGGQCRRMTSARSGMVLGLRERDGNQVPDFSGALEFNALASRPTACCVDASDASVRCA